MRSRGGLPRSAGSYDKLVSIEMIEAVGWQRIGTFFGAARSCCTPRRDAASGDHDRRPRLRGREGLRAFIKEYIFPGGCLPSIEVIAQRRAPDRPADGRSRGHHRQLRRDAAPLARELRRPLADELERLGYDERFQRLWTLYLAYCEAGFAERRICDVQLLFAKPRWAAQVTTQCARSATAAAAHAPR